MIRQHGGIFGRNPTYQNVEVNGIVTVHGDPYLPQSAETTNTFGESPSSQGNGTGAGGATAPIVLYKGTSENPAPYNDVTNKTPLSIQAWQESLFGVDPGWVGNIMFSVVNPYNGNVNFSVLDNGTINTPVANATTLISTTGSIQNLVVNEAGLAGTTDGPFFIMYGNTGDSGIVWQLRDSAFDFDDNGIPDPVMNITDEGNIFTCGSVNCSSLQFGLSGYPLNAITSYGSSLQQSRLTRASTAVFTAASWLGITTTYGALKVIIQARNSTAARYELVEMNVIWNDGVTTVTSSVVNSLVMGASLGTYAFDQQFNNTIRLRITPALTSSTSFTITSMALSRP
jgi:hypothetical protein